MNISKEIQNLMIPFSQVYIGQWIHIYEPNTFVVGLSVRPKLRLNSLKNKPVNLGSIWKTPNRLINLFNLFIMTSIKKRHEKEKKEEERKKNSCLSPDVFCFCMSFKEKCPKNMSLPKLIYSCMMRKKEITLGQKRGLFTNDNCILYTT